MPIQEETPEIRIQRTITAAFDSVGLIEDIIAGIDRGESDPQQISRMIDANVGHLKIVLGYEGIAAAMTEEQSTRYNAAIVAGETYLVEHPIT